MMNKILSASVFSEQWIVSNTQLIERAKVNLPGNTFTRPLATHAHHEVLLQQTRVLQLDLVIISKSPRHHCHSANRN